MCWCLFIAYPVFTLALEDRATLFWVDLTAHWTFLRCHYLCYKGYPKAVPFYPLLASQFYLSRGSSIFYRALFFSRLQWSPWSFINSFLLLRLRGCVRNASSMQCIYLYLHRMPNLDVYHHQPLVALFQHLPLSVKSFPPWGFWCWPDLVNKPVGGKHVSQHLLDKIVSHLTIITNYPCSVLSITICKDLWCTSLLQLLGWQ